MDYRQVCLTIAADGPPMSTAHMLKLADALWTRMGKIVNKDDLVVAARNNPKVMAFIKAGTPIYAIKELRAATLCGLKEAKDAVDTVRDSL